MLRSVKERDSGLGAGGSGELARRIWIWLFVLLLALNAAAMVVTGWLRVESYKLQAEAAELVYLSTVKQQIHVEIDCAKVAAKR